MGKFLMQGQLQKAKSKLPKGSKDIAGIHKKSLVHMQFKSFLKESLPFAPQ